MNLKVKREENNQLPSTSLQITLLGSSDFFSSPKAQMNEEWKPSFLIKAQIQNSHMSHSRLTSELTTHVPHAICTPHMCQLLLQTRDSVQYNIPLHDIYRRDQLMISLKCKWPRAHKQSPIAKRLRVYPSSITITYVVTKFM